MFWFGKKKNKQAGAATASPEAKVIRVSSYLSDKSIRFFQSPVSKEEAFKELIGLMGLPNPDLALKSVMEREAAGPTVIAPGIAIPHARVEGLTQLVASLGISQAGISDPSVEGGVIRLCLLFVGPLTGMKEHLGFLASTASLFQMDGFGDLLLQQTTSADVIAKIKEAEKTL